MGALSKGCGTCKRRKVKCDETRPECVRCRNAGIECTGFAPRLKFVDEGSRVRRSMKASRQPEASNGISLNLVPPLGNSLPLTAFKDDIFISYLLCRFFERDGPYLAHTTGQSSRCGLPADWIPELGSEKPRYKSWDALATIVFGQAHQSYDVISLAFRLYGQALSELRSELSSSENRCTDSTLASITALYLYEIFVTGTAKCWMWHANGLAWLLERRGPWQQKFYANKAIFLEHRIMLIAKSIVSRQSTFLHDLIWKTVPWEGDPTSKSAIDYLVDIGADIAECLARSKTHDIGKSSQEIDELEKRVATSLEDLNIWWHQMGAQHAQTAIEVTSFQAISIPLFPTLLEYDTVWAAFTICTYNAIRILLLQLWQMLQLYPSSVQKINPTVVLDIPNRTALLGITSDSRGLACEILRSLTFCYRKSRRFVSTFTFLFIQEVAYGCFDQDSREARWVTQHGWSKLVNLDDSEHENLLKSLLPSGQIYIK